MKSFDDALVHKTVSELFDMVKSKQAEIDELRKRIEKTEKWVESNKRNIPLSEWHGYTTEEYVDSDDLLEILKGNKDD